MQQKKNVCFISPHPDDIELYCGGALLDHVYKNDNITVIMMTNGDRGSANPLIRGQKLALRRRNEAKARYALIDNLNLIFADYNDTQLVSNNTSVAHLEHLIAPLAPDIIYLPEFITQISERKHNDHLSSGIIVHEVSQKLKHPVFLRCYHSTKPNTFINISRYYEQNNEALLYYKSQQGYSISAFVYGITYLRYRYNRKRRLWGTMTGCDYAEGFREHIIDQSGEVNQ